MSDRAGVQRGEARAALTWNACMASQCVMTF